MKGIYVIENTKTKQCYVGQSTNIRKRWNDHIRHLEKGKHHSQKLQKAYNEYGFESFSFSILEVCERDTLNQKESEWILKLDALENGYNMKPGEIKLTFMDIKNRVHKPLSFFEKKTQHIKEILKREITIFFKDLDLFVTVFRFPVRMLILGFIPSIILNIILFSIFSMESNGWLVLPLVFTVVLGIMILMISEPHIEKWEEVKKRASHSAKHNPNE
jgi:hypothetical protein